VFHPFSALSGSCVLDEIMTEGWKHLFAGEWSEAEAIFLKAVEIKPDQKAAELNPNYAQAYYHQALCLADIDKNAQATAPTSIKVWKRPGKVVHPFPNWHRKSRRYSNPPARFNFSHKERKKTCPT